jgi:chitodextrinase
MQNNVAVGTVAGNILTYNATNLTASTTYSFNVLALDAAGNISPPSNTVQITTGTATDTQAPTAPTNLTASNTTTTALTLNWGASTDNVGVTQYQIMQNNVAVGTVAGNILTYNATNLTASTTYSFNVLALDAAGNISPPSNTVQVTTQSDGTGGGTPYTTLNANLPTVNWQAQNLFVAGTMGIGTSANSNFQLSVNGDIRTKELVVESGWSDFVFKPGYRLPSLQEVEQHINEHGHLKDIPSAFHVQKYGIGLADINMRLLQKIEELTLYLIEAQKRLEVLEKSGIQSATALPEEKQLPDDPTY